MYLPCLSSQGCPSPICALFLLPSIVPGSAGGRNCCHRLCFSFGGNSWWEQVLQCFCPPRHWKGLILLSVPNLAGFGYQSELELRVAEAARRQYNKLKMQTKAEIRQTLDRLLVGDFIVSGCTQTPLRGWGRGRCALCQVLYLFWIGMLVSITLTKLKLWNPYQLAKNPPKTCLL